MPCILSYNSCMIFCLPCMGVYVNRAVDTVGCAVCKCMGCYEVRACAESHLTGSHVPVRSLFPLPLLLSLLSGPKPQRTVALRYQRRHGQRGERQRRQNCYQLAPQGVQ